MHGVEHLLDDFTVFPQIVSRSLKMNKNRQKLEFLDILHFLEHFLD